MNSDEDEFAGFEEDNPADFNEHYFPPNDEASGYDDN